MTRNYDPNGNPLGKGKGKSYGKEKESRIQKRRAQLSQSAGDPFDWRVVSADRLLHLIAIVASCGGAVRVGVTRDGGAMAVGYYLDGNSWTEYVRPNEDCEAYLDGAIGDWLGECEGRGINH